MKQKQEFKKNRDQIGAFISNYRRKPRKQCDKNEKIKRLPFGARSLKNYYFTAAVKKQNSVFFSRKKPNVVQCVNQFHEIFSSITIIIPAVRYNRCYATIVPFI